MDARQYYEFESEIHDQFLEIFNLKQQIEQLKSENAQLKNNLTIMALEN